MTAATRLLFAMADHGQLPVALTRVHSRFHTPVLAIVVTAAAALVLALCDTRAPDLFLCPGTGAPGVPPAVATAPAPNAAVANDQTSTLTRPGYLPFSSNVATTANPW